MLQTKHWPGSENDLHDPRHCFNSMMSNFFSFLTIIRIKLWTKKPKVQLEIGRDRSLAVSRGWEGVCRWPTPQCCLRPGSKRILKSWKSADLGAGATSTTSHSIPSA